jgi:hypothetical protein
MRHRRFRYYLFMFIIVTLLVTLAGCGNTGSTQATQAPTSVAQAAEAVAPATSQPEQPAAAPTQAAASAAPTPVPQSAGPAAPPAKGEPLTCQDIGKVAVSSGARIERGQVTQPAGGLISISGSFPERPVDEPCVPGPQVAPVDVASGGTVRVVLDGSPPAPCQWSLYNSGTALSLDYLPAMGRNFGPAQRIAEISLSCESEDDRDTHLEITAEVPGPGRLQAYVGAPGGAGPLTSSCFAQSFSAQVEMVEPNPEAPVVDGTTLNSGDHLRTDPGGYAVLFFPPATSVLVNSDVVFETNVAAGTVPLDSAGFPLTAKLIEYQRLGMPLPRQADHAYYGEGALAEALQSAEKAKNPCEAAVEVKLLLDGQAGHLTFAKLRDLAGTQIPTKPTDILVFLLKSYGVYAGWLSPLSPLINAPKLAEAVMEQYDTYHTNALYPAALQTWRTSATWTRAQTETEAERLKMALQANDAKIEAMTKEFEDWKKANQPPPPQITPGSYGGVYQGGMGHQAFGEEAIKRELALHEQIKPLLYENMQYGLQRTVLTDYRLPLIDRPCDERLKAQECNASQTTLKLLEGTLHIYHPADPGTTLPGQGVPQISVDGTTIVPSGTEFVVQKTDEGGRVAVVNGLVTVFEPDGRHTVVEAGQQLTWPAGEVGDYDLGADDGGLVGGVPLGELLLDDVYADTDAAGPSSWIWQDPGNDATVEAPEPDVLRITVPTGNELWGGSVEAPRLLRKVSGDFDLEGEILFETDATHFAVAEFLLYAPGSYLGYLARQMDPGGATAHYRILGGGWSRDNGYDKLMSIACTLPWWDVTKCPDAPDHPVKMRLTRRGDVWRTYWSSDGEYWTLSTVQEILAPDTLWVGWLFKRVAHDGLQDVAAVTTLRDLKLVSAPRDLLPLPGWETITPQGFAWANDGAVYLALDGTQLGNVRVQHGQRLEGDFDVVVRLLPEPWTRQPGETYSFALEAASTDELNHVYVGFSETDARRIFNSDMEINQGWYRYREVQAPGDPATWLRMTRRGGQVTTSFWTDCQWQEVASFQDAFAMPLFLRLTVGNEWEATLPAAVAADFFVEQLLTGEEVGAVEWQPDACGATEAGAATSDTGGSETLASSDSSGVSQSKDDHSISDDFSAETFSWCVAADDIAVSGYEDEAYFMHALQPNYRTLCFVPVTFFPTVAEFDARVPKGYQGGSFGLLCHYQSPDDFYSVEVDLDSRSLYVRQRLDGESYPLTDPGWIELSYLNPAVTDTNHILVACDPDLITVFINDGLEAQVPLDPLAEPGDMAVFVKGWEEMGSQGYKVFFDNFGAWKPVQ